MAPLTGTGAFVANFGSKEAERLAEAIRAAGASVHRWDVDTDRGSCADEDEVDEAFDAAASTLPSLDAVVQVLSVGSGECPLGALSERGWHRTSVLPVRGAFLVSRRCVQEFLGSGRGRLVTIVDAAMGGGLGVTIAVPALTSLSRCIAKEYGKRKITSNVLVLEQPAPDMAAVADVVVHLVSDAASFVTGERIVVSEETATCRM